MRKLCLDIGDKRIGVAISDDTNKIALPLETIQRERGVYQKFIGLIKQHQINHIIYGKAVDLEGLSGEQDNKNTTFIENLKKSIKNSSLDWEVCFDTFDERFTTQLASRELSRMEVKDKNKKKSIDKIAATLILQNYLDSDNCTKN